MINRVRKFFFSQFNKNRGNASLVETASISHCLHLKRDKCSMSRQPGFNEDHKPKRETTGLIFNNILTFINVR